MAEVVEWSDFSGGEAGRLGLTKPPKANVWSGRNMLVYANGLLGPRPGLKKLTLPNAATGVVVGLRPTTFGAVVTAILDITAGRLRVLRFDLGVLTGTYADLTTASTYGGDVDVVYTTLSAPNGFYFTFDGKVYRFEEGTPGTITEITGYVPGSTWDSAAIVQTGVRLAKAEGGRLRYSDANDPTTWSASNFVDFPSTILGLLSYKDGLYVLLQDEIWVLAGTLGTSDSRTFRVTDQRGISALMHAASTDAGVALWPSSAANPATFDGAAISIVSHILGSEAPPLLATSTAPDSFGVGASQGDTADLSLAYTAHGDFTASGGSLVNRLCLLHNGVWSMHDWAVTLSAGVAGSFGYPGTFIMSSVGDAGVTPDYYVFSPQMANRVDTVPADRPGFTSDAFRQPGDDSTTPVDAYASMPEYWLPAGEEARVRQVIVDIVKWDTGSVTPNQLDVTVETFGRRGADGEASATKSWTEAGASATTAGVRQRLVFDMGVTQPGSGFQVKLTNVKGVAVRAVRAAYDPYPGRPRR